MEALLSFLPLVGCAVMMAACMGLMGRVRRRPSDPQPQTHVPSAEEVAALREEVARLRAEHAADLRQADD